MFLILYRNYAETWSSAMDLAGHHYGMPRDMLMIGDMRWSATSLQNDQKCL